MLAGRLVDHVMIITHCSSYKPVCYIPSAANITWLHSAILVPPLTCYLKFLIWFTTMFFNLILLFHVQHAFVYYQKFPEWFILNGPAMNYTIKNVFLGYRGIFSRFFFHFEGPSLAGYFPSQLKFLCIFFVWILERSWQILPAIIWLCFKVTLTVNTFVIEQIKWLRGSGFSIWWLHWPTKFYFFTVFLTKIDFFLIIYGYLTTECGKIFTLSDLIFAHNYVKDTYYKGLLNKVKSYNWQSKLNAYLENKYIKQTLK